MDNSKKQRYEKKSVEKRLAFHFFLNSNYEFKNKLLARLTCFKVNVCK